MLEGLSPRPVHGHSGLEGELAEGGLIELEFRLFVAGLTGGDAAPDGALDVGIGGGRDRPSGELFGKLGSIGTGHVG